MSSSDYVICIDDGYTSRVTKGKVYKYIRKGEGGRFCKVIDDRGIISQFFSRRFRLVKKNKINKLLFDFSVV